MGKKGLTVVLAAASGPVSCLRYVQRCFPGRSIDTVIGGMHLSDVTESA
jgi:metal-dependent hydrolase (beta-lactamase superfamily II)